jgi:fluoride ion exporter CrcB/FEX
MTPLEVVLVAAAGAAGAVLRHELTSRGRAVRATAVVNVVGAGLLGALAVALPPGAALVVGGGLLGSTTTFSAWMVHAEAAPDGWRVVLLPLVAGVLAAIAGRLLATAAGFGP